MPNHDPIKSHSEKLMNEAMFLDQLITKMMGVRLPMVATTAKDQTAIAVLVAGFIAGRAEQTTAKLDSAKTLYEMAKTVGRETAAAIQAQGER